MRPCSNLLKKSLMENFIFCAMKTVLKSLYFINLEEVFLFIIKSSLLKRISEKLRKLKYVYTCYWFTSSPVMSCRQIYFVFNVYKTSTDCYHIMDPRYLKLVATY